LFGNADSSRSPVEVTIAINVTGIWLTVDRIGIVEAKNAFTLMAQSTEGVPATLACVRTGAINWNGLEWFGAEHNRKG